MTSEFNKIFPDDDNPTLQILFRLGMNCSYSELVQVVFYHPFVNDDIVWDIHHIAAIESYRNETAKVRVNRLIRKIKVQIFVVLIRKEQRFDFIDCNQQN